MILNGGWLGNTYMQTNTFLCVLKHPRHYPGTLNRVSRFFSAGTCFNILAKFLSHEATLQTL